MNSALTYGLSSLMKATKLSQSSEDAGDALFEAFDNSIDEDIIGCLHGDTDPDDDSIESSIAGNGIEDDEKMEALLERIPADDEDINDKIEQLVESCLPILD